MSAVTSVTGAYGAVIRQPLTIQIPSGPRWSSWARSTLTVS